VKGYNALINASVMEILHEYDQVLAGTLPPDIFLKAAIITFFVI